MQVENIVLGFQGKPVHKNPSPVAVPGETAADRGTPSEDGFSKLIQELLGEKNQKEKRSADLPDSLMPGLMTIFSQLPPEVALQESEEEGATEVISALNPNSESPEVVISIHSGATDSAEQVFSEELITAADLPLIGEEEVTSDFVKTNPQEPSKEEPAIAIEGSAREGTSPLAPLESEENPTVSLPEADAIQALNQESAPTLSNLVSAPKKEISIENQPEKVSAPEPEHPGEKPVIEPLVTGEGSQNSAQPVELRTKLSAQQEPSGEAEYQAESKVSEGEQVRGEKMQALDFRSEKEAEFPPVVKSVKEKKVDLFNPVVSPNIEPTESVERLSTKAEIPLPLNVSPEEVTTQILQGAKMMVKNGVAKVQLQLEPAELGKLELSLVIERDLVAARFVAETPGVQSLIEANLPQLRSSLQEAGLRVDLLQVGVQTNSDQQMQYQSSSSGYQSDRGSTFTGRPAEMVVMEEKILGDEAWHGLVNMRV